MKWSPGDFSRACVVKMFCRLRGAFLVGLFVLAAAQTAEGGMARSFDTRERDHSERRIPINNTRFPPTHPITTRIKFCGTGIIFFTFSSYETTKYY